MLVARRALASSSRSCLFGRALSGPALHPEVLQAGNGRPSCIASKHRCFGARIRRHANDEAVAESAPVARPDGGTASAGLSAEVQGALTEALAGEVAAVRRLGVLAADIDGLTGVAAEAERALHRVLLEFAGDGADEIRIAADESLQKCWHESGDPQVNDSVRRGVALMDKEHYSEAAKVFTEVIERLPSYAEGWNKRATARFFMKDIDGALEDCEQVMLLKPLHFACQTAAGMFHERRGDLKGAARWFRRALAVHPGLEGPRRSVKAMESQSLINDHLRPRIVATVQALNDGGQLPAKVPNGLSCSWDIWKAQDDAVDEEPGHNYFCRVRVLNASSGPQKVRSLARFYVFRFADGRMLPLTLLTEGPSSFTLRPGEDYRFSWQLISSEPLQRAVGGMVLQPEAEDELDIRTWSAAAGEDSKLLIDVDLGAIGPADASKDEVERMRVGHKAMGRLDLRRMDAIQSAPKQSQTK